LIGLLAAAAAHAGVVQGSIQEQATGLSLARTVVRLVPVPRADNVDLKTLQQRTGSAGQFVFFNVPDGYYFLIAVREGYFPGAYGQRRPNGQGTPILVTKESDLFAQLRLRRKGAVTGRVLDENGVGIEGVPVIAYKSRLPLRVAAQGVSDDRGVYRIHGLDAGKYWVRTTAHTLDDGTGMLPTFGPQSREVKDARAHEVRLDEDTPDADIHAEFGRLFTLSGVADCIEGEAKVTISSETIRKTTQVGCGGKYTFPSLAPGVYEFSAVTTNGLESGFFEAFYDRMREDATVKLAPVPTVEFIARRAGSSSPVPVIVTGRRQDLFDSDREQQLPMRGPMMAGRWEVSAQAGPDEYIASIGNYSARQRPAETAAADWFDILVEIQRQQQVRIVVAGPAAKIMGAVSKDGKGVPGASVFLWPATEAIRRSLRGYRMAIADTEGKYHFEGLPPGDYRMLATFDFTEIDEAALDEARAVVVQAKESQRTVADLTLWVSP
jgi:protocatechuate 3,4-dioxygenase beta subunit